MLLGSAQGLLVGGVILFSPYFRGRANRYMAFTLLVVVLLGINDLLYDYLSEEAWFITWNDMMWEFLFPATFFLYFIHALDHALGRKPGLRWAVFAPFLLTMVINLVIDLDMEWGVYHLAFVDDEPAIYAYYFWEEVAVLVFVVLMIAAAFLILRAGPAAKPWHWRFWWMASAVMGCWIAIWLLDLFGAADLYAVLWTAITVLFFWVTYRGVFQLRLAEEKYEIRAKRSVREREEPPGAGPAEENPYLRRLARWMEEEHGYRDPNLSRDSVAEGLGISSGYLSQLLSACWEKSFSDYINALRVEDVKRMLLDDEFADYSLLAIGLEAGFNSKSTFYATFKKATGRTPSAFRGAYAPAPHEAFGPAT